MKRIHALFLSVLFGATLTVTPLSLGGKIATAAAQTGGAAPQAADPAQEIQALQKRIKTLEQQIADLQALYGTVESLARNGSLGGAPQGGGFGTVPKAVTDRLDALELQIRALSGSSGRAVPQAPVAPNRQGSYRPSSPPPVPATSFQNRERQFSDYSEQVPPSRDAYNSQGVTAQDLGSFGTEVRPEESGGLAAQPLQDVAPPPPVGAKALYEEAYGLLLQRNYDTAEVKFSEFLKRHPKDSLAGNAQFWLAESYYVRGNYRKAAENFLKGYKTYKAGSKAPDSLLKLAMSLKELGQKEAACTTFQELGAKFPNAPNHVRQRADAERRRAGC